MRRSEFVKFRMDIRKKEQLFWDWHKIIVQSGKDCVRFAGLGKESMISFEPADNDRIECKLWRPDGAWVNQRVYDEARDADRRLAQWVHDETEEDW